VKKNLFLVFFMTALWVMAEAGWPVREGSICSISMESACAASTLADLTGRWNCNDGGTYYVHQIGKTVWWFGESRDKGGSWTNVFQGQIQENLIRGQWVDVPHGTTMNSGEMTLQIQAPDRLVAIKKTGGFGGSQWSR